MSAASAHDPVIVTTTPDTGTIEASTTFEAECGRIFQALTSQEICDWWVRPGVFDTREWIGDLRNGGKWKASGMGGGQAYQLEGEFVEIDAPRRLVHTWQAVGAPGQPSHIFFDLTPDPSGTRLMFRHTGIMHPEVLERTRAGWVSSFQKLKEIVEAQR